MSKESINIPPCSLTAVMKRQVKLYADTSSQNKLPSIAQFIRKAFLVSDNDAYNRMYQFRRPAGN
jgi:hypothetical protein